MRMKLAHILAGLTVMMSSTRMAVAVSDPSWIEHIDIATTVICALFSIVTFFALRTLKQIDQSQKDLAANQKEIFQRITQVENNFFELKGEHEARKDVCRYPAREAV